METSVLTKKVEAEPVPPPRITAFADYLSEEASLIVKARSGERSRLKLLGAGARLLDAANYRDLLVEEISAAADVAKGTFYIYFKTKDRFLLDLGSRYIDFEIKSYPRFSRQLSEFQNSRRFIAWYEQTFAANAGVLRCMVQMGSTEPAMRSLWHRRNGQLVDRVTRRWTRDNPEADADLHRWILRTSGAMLDQSLFERFHVDPGVGLAMPESEDFLLDVHALLNFRALFGRNPPLDEFDPGSRIRLMLERENAGKA